MNPRKIFGAKKWSTTSHARKVLATRQAKTGSLVFGMSWDKDKFKEYIGI